MPSIEVGGVEKNLFLISNYLSTKIRGIKLITADKKDKKFRVNYVDVNDDFIKFLKNYKKLIDTNNLKLIDLVKKISLKDK